MNNIIILSWTRICVYVVVRRRRVPSVPDLLFQQVQERAEIPWPYQRVRDGAE